MKLAEAVMLLEDYGLKPSLLCNGIGFLREVAKVIKELESDKPFTLKKVLSLQDLKDGDFLVFSGPVERLPYPEELERLRDSFRDLMEKKIHVMVLDEDTEFERMNEGDRHRLYKFLRASLPAHLRDET